MLWTTYTISITLSELAVHFTEPTNIARIADKVLVVLTVLIVRVARTLQKNQTPQITLKKHTNQMARTAHLAQIAWSKRTLQTLLTT